MSKKFLGYWLTGFVCLATGIAIEHVRNTSATSVAVIKPESENPALSIERQRNIFYVLMLANDKANFEAEFQYPTAMNGKLNSQNEKQRADFFQKKRSEYQKKVAAIFEISDAQMTHIIGLGYEPDKQWWQGQD